METSFTDCGTDSLLLLKERIIKTEVLLERYACLTKKFNDLEKSYLQAVDNEKKAKKDATKYLEKYCKITKKSNCFLNKIKTLEDTVKEKTNELKECQDELRKLESVLEMFKAERKGHQYLKRDKDFLLSTFWKVLRRLEEEHRDCKIKKLAETFFKRFERELMELKLQDFRSNKPKNLSRPTEQEPDIALSPGSEDLDSVEYDFMDMDLAAELEKSVEETEGKYGAGKLKHSPVNASKVDKKYCNNDVKSVAAPNSSKSCKTSFPGLSFDPFIFEKIEENPNASFAESHILNNGTTYNALNNEHNREGGSNSTDLNSVCFPTTDSHTSGTLMENNYLELEECSNFESECLPQPDGSKDDTAEGTVARKFKKTYCSPKSTTLNLNNAATEKQSADHSDNRSSINVTPGEVSNAVDNMKSIDLDSSNGSSEIVGVDPDNSLGSVENIADHSKYCDKIYDFLTETGAISHPKEKLSNNEDSSSLLFLMENELANQLGVSMDAPKCITQDSPKIGSIFDVDDCGNPVSVGNKEVTETCLEFSFDNRNVISLNEEVVNKGCDAVETEDMPKLDEISETEGNKNQCDKQFESCSEPTLKETNEDSKVTDNTVKEKLRDSSTTQVYHNISDEEIFRILKGFRNVPLLTPLIEKERSKSRALVNLETPKCDNDSSILTKNVQTADNHKSALISKPDNKEEEVYLHNSGTSLPDQKKMVDKIIQTETESHCREECEKAPGSKCRSKRIVFYKDLTRRICTQVWERNLKKLKYINYLGKIWKSHSPCFAFMKILMGMIGRPQFHDKYRTRTSSSLLKRKNRTKKIVPRAKKQKMSSWQVEDVEMANVVPEDQSLFNGSIVEACGFFAPVPVHHYLSNKLGDSSIGSDEIQLQEKNLSFNWFTSHRELELGTKKLQIYDNTCKSNFRWEHETGSNMDTQHCYSGAIVNDCKKESERCVKTYNAEKCVEDTSQTDLDVDHILEINVRSKEDSDAMKPETGQSEQLEQCCEIKKTEREPEEIGEKTVKSAVILRRSSRIYNRTKRLMAEESHKTVSVHEESQNQITDNSCEVPLSYVSGDSASSHESSTDRNADDHVSNKESPEKSKSKKLKEKFEELFGEPESQSECSSLECGKDLDATFKPPKRQEIIPLDARTDISETNSEASVIVRKKRRLSHSSIKSNVTTPKSNKWDLLSLGDDEDVEGRFNEDEDRLNNTFFSDCVTSGDSSNILDSIMTAMTKQTELFKVQAPLQRPDHNDTCNSNIRWTAQASPKDCISTAPVGCKISKEYKMNGNHSTFLNLPYCWSLGDQLGNQNFKEKICRNNSGRNFSEEAKLKSLVRKEIGTFLKSDINTVEEGEEKIKSCLVVLKKASEDIIANVIVSEIMANVDEELKEFERPSPPLTQTQHRIMIILTTLSSSDEEFHRIGNKILKVIWSKLFPENFFWPDDSLEMATRFFAALCKRLNNFKGIWKFCFKAITSMRQRWCIPVFVVLQVWPDILHNANEIQDNLLVNTFVNIILHTPKVEEMRRKRQEQKLLAIKHLLINFYNFEVNTTIEGFAQKLLESLLQDVPGSVDALVLVAKCRAWSWTRKNIIDKLLETLSSWLNGNASDIIGSKILDILKQITPVFPDHTAAEASSVTDIISILTRALSSEKIVVNKAAEENTIRILCSLCHYPDVKDILLRVSEKFSSAEPLYADIKRALTLKYRKGKEINRKVNKKVELKLRKKMKTKKKGKKKKPIKKNPSRQKNANAIN